MAPKRHLVVSVIVDGMSPLEPSVSAEFFGIERTTTGGPWYRHEFCTETPGPVHLAGGMDLTIDRGLEALRRADTVVLPGWSNSSEPPSEALADALRRAHARGARLVSFCSGAFALAYAGLLDGRRATTHWELADKFARTFPLVHVDPSVLYIDDGNILTSAGSAASIDLALYLVRADFGAEVANFVARDLVVPPHRDGGQAQYIESPVSMCNEADPLSDTLVWAAEHLDEPLSVELLAARAAMSPRNFARRFRATTGTTPHQWLVTQRLALAQELLETTNLPVDVVAERSGFGTAASFRIHFQRHVRTTPQAYRRTFCGAALAVIGGAVDGAIMGRMEPRSTSLRMFGAPSPHGGLEWSWVDDELRRAPTYWVAGTSTSRPHPRPVWGVWSDEELHLSIGSPALRAQLAADPRVTVHLDSGLDVVMIEGTVTGQTDHPSAVGAYDSKYDWSYSVEDYGPLTTVAPDVVLAWRAAGPAGRDGFTATGRWRFDAG